MADNNTVSARIDPVIKEKAEVVLAAIGLSLADAYRMLLARVASEQRLPFEPLVPNETTIRAMLEARREEGRRFETIDDLMADLAR